MNNLNQQLLEATKNNDLLLIINLLNQGANINAKNYKNSTPLIIASYYGFINIVEYLVNNGANIEAINIHNYTALKYAISHNKLDIITLLKNYKSNKELLLDYLNTLKVNLTKSIIPISSPIKRIQNINYINRKNKIKLITSNQFKKQLYVQF